MANKDKDPNSASTDPSKTDSAKSKPQDQPEAKETSAPKLRPEFRQANLSAEFYEFGVDTLGKPRTIKFKVIRDLILMVDDKINAVCSDWGVLPDRSVMRPISEAKFLQALDSLVVGVTEQEPPLQYRRGAHIAPPKDFKKHDWRIPGQNNVPERDQAYRFSSLDENGKPGTFYIRRKAAVTELFSADHGIGLTQHPGALPLGTKEMGLMEEIPLAELEAELKKI